MASTTTLAMGSTSASHPYTCNTCQVAYRSIDLQKGHMKSDWHRYNLKRRVASLPPISTDVFTEKVLQARAVSTAEADKAYFERACDVCQKTYYSENAFQNHLSSQKHRVKEAHGEQPVPARADDEATSVVSSTFSLGIPMASTQNEVDSDAEEEFNQVVEGLNQAKLSEQRPSPVKRPSNPHHSAEAGSEEGASTVNYDDDSATPQTAEKPVWALESCLFCNFTSATVQSNTQHMERFHGMFIPERNYLVDLDGLLRHLQEKIGAVAAHQCIFCAKMKTTLFGVQTHMRDKGHCKIPFETEAEQLDIGDFYDFRSTYSDDEEDDQEGGDELSGGARLGARREARLAGEDGEELKHEDADGWETDSSASSLDSADLTAVPAEGRIHQFERLEKHPHHSHHDARNRHQADGWHSHAHKHTHAVFHDEYELHLPSGKSVGHRSLNKYFRQNLHSHPSAEERAEQLAIDQARVGESDSRLTTSGNRGREVVPRGAAGMLGVGDQVREGVRRAERRGRKRETLHTKKNDWAYSNKLNNHENYYYREQGGG